MFKEMNSMYHSDRPGRWIFKAACVGVVLNTLLIVARCNVRTEIFNAGSVTAAMQNYVCSGDDVLMSVSADGMLQCSVICTSDTNCMGFFYHTTENVCVTCKEWYRNTNDLESYNGMQYYRVQTGVYHSCF